MKKQTFKVYVRVEAEVESQDKPYLTEARVKNQIQRFLKGHSIVEDLPCHGESSITVTECIEDTKN